MRVPRLGHQPPNDNPDAAQRTPAARVILLYVLGQLGVSTSRLLSFWMRLIEKSP